MYEKIGEQHRWKVSFIFLGARRKGPIFMVCFFGEGESMN
jgi:hypothetical protein